MQTHRWLSGMKGKGMSSSCLEMQCNLGKGNLRNCKYGQELPSKVEAEGLKDLAKMIYFRVMLLIQFTPEC